MIYKNFHSDLPLHRTIVFTSVEENEETMRRCGVNQEVRQLGKKKFRSGVRFFDRRIPQQSLPQMLRPWGGVNKKDGGGGGSRTRVRKRSA